jgi:two-component system response regulator ChvI
MKRIALIEDDRHTQERYSEELRAAGFTVDAYETIEDARQGLLKQSYDAMVLDLELGSNRYAGLDLLREARDAGQQLPPVIVTSSLPPETFRPKTLQLGAWDHVPKPIEAGTLAIKMQRLLDSATNRDSAVRNVGSLQWNLAEPGVLLWRKKRVRVAITGWKLVDLLATRAPSPVDYDELTKKLLTGDRDALRQHVATVRQAFRDIDPGFDAIHAVPGKGYMWTE